MDIDIDFPTNFNPKIVMPNLVKASIVSHGELKPHPCGFYAQTIPIDNQTSLASIPYDVAEHMGFFKIDFLHLSLLNDIRSKSEVRALMSTPPPWHLLQDQQVVSQLFHVHKQAHLLSLTKPTSVQVLADTLALMRPGKRHLIQRYLVDPESTRLVLYTKPDSGYYFKKSHAISYALTIVVQLNKLVVK